VTVREAQQLGENVLRQAKIESRRIDSYMLLEMVTGQPRAWLFAHPDEELSSEQSQRFIDLLDRRRKRTPMVHLTNKREFYGLEFYIDERVLTPRVETEKMAEWAIKHASQHSKLIDIGTGSGALAIAIKKHRPDLEVWATDVSSEALEVAEQNAHTHQTTIQFVESDLWDKVGGQFKTAVTNLPYLEDEADLMPEVQKEPAVALFGGADGLDLYRRFLRDLPTYLEHNGWLFTECDPWQHDSLIKLAEKARLKLVEQDYFILGFQRTDEFE
jgi:release factor glutamine methyltransferase